MVDLETVFLKTPLAAPLEYHEEDKENARHDNGEEEEVEEQKDVFFENDDLPLSDALEAMVPKGRLTSPEQRMSVEEWLRRNARLGEDRLRRECDRMVCLFEREGNRALQALEGIIILD